MDKQTAIQFYSTNKHHFEKGDYIFFMDEKDRLMFMASDRTYGLVNGIRDATKDKPISVLKTNIKQLMESDVN